MTRGGESPKAKKAKTCDENCSGCTTWSKWVVAEAAPLPAAGLLPAGLVARAGRPILTSWQGKQRPAVLRCGCVFGHGKQGCDDRPQRPIPRVGTKNRRQGE